MSKTGQVIKKYLHKFLIMLVIMTLIIPFVPNISRAESSYTYNGVTVTLSDDGIMTISGEGRIIRNHIELFEEESNDFEDIKKVIINEGITGIDPEAFAYFFNLKDIQLPKSLNFISQDAFRSCSSLEKIDIPIGVTCTWYDVFTGCCSLRSISFYNNTTKIMDPLFDNQGLVNPCHDLTIYGYENSTAQKYYEENEEYFKNYNIKFAIIRQHETEDEEQPEQPEQPETPEQPQDEEDVITINGIKYFLDLENRTATVWEVSNEAITGEGKLFIPNIIRSKTNKSYPVTKIAAGAVQLEGIRSIKLPETLKIIYNNAFTKYTGDIEIPKNVEEMDINAFSTHNVNIRINNENKSLFLSGDNMALYSTVEKPSILHGFMNNFSEEQNLVTVPECVTQISDNAFKYCHNFKKIKIGSQVKDIGYTAFEGIEDKVTIQGYEGSYVQDYAKQHNIEFKSLGTLPFFRWTKDNYSFENNGRHFSSYEIGDFKKVLSNALLEKYNNEKKNEQWGGSCFGMASTAMLFQYGQLNQEYWKEGNNEVKETYDLNSPKENERLRWLINTYHFLQNYLKDGCFEQIEETHDILENQKKELEEFYKEVKKYYQNNNYETLLCTYHWGDAGHAVLITGAPEEIDINSYKERGWDFNSKDYYGHRVPIYNVNDSKQQEYIYIKEDYSGMAIGTNSSISQKFQTTSDDMSDTKKIEFISVDAYKLNNKEIFSLENILKNNESYEFSKTYDFDNFWNGKNYIEYKNATPVKITNSKGEYKQINNLFNTEGELEVRLEPILGETADDGTSEKIEDVEAVVNEDKLYSVETVNKTDALDTSITTPNSYMSAKTTAGGKVTFEDKNAVTLENPTGNEYQTKLTLNDEFVTLPWYTITISGTGAKEVKTQMTKEGIMVSGDNLKNLTITGNNDKDETKLNINTDKNTVLIKANKAKTSLVAYVDNNGDGTYETQIDNTVANKELSKTGLQTTFLIIITNGIVVCLILYLKYKKYDNI